jgi:hypothetical protein
LIDKKTFLLKIKMKYYFPILFIIPMILSVPGYFAIKIESININNSTLYYSVFTDFGNSEVYHYFIFLAAIIESVIPIFILIFMTILNIRCFNKVMKKKLEVNRSLSNKIKSSEMNFSRMVISMTFFFIVAHVFDCSGALSVRYFKIFNITINQNIFSKVNLYRQFCVFMLFFHYSICFIICLAMDKNIMNLVKSYSMKLVIKYYIFNLTKIRFIIKHLYSFELIQCLSLMLFLICKTIIYRAEKYKTI